MIYGGGRIFSISDPDKVRNVVARIIDSFMMSEPIKQGNSVIEDIKWTSKKKVNDSLQHF